jgi:hypothetical protein
MNRSSSRRRSLSQTSSSSPGTVRKLRSTVRKVQFSDSVRNKKNLNDTNKSITSQQLTTTNEEELQIANNLNDQEMTPSNIINSLSLSDEETSNNTTMNQMITSNKSPSVSDSEEENEDSITSNGPNMNNSKNQQLSKKTELLNFFDELENHSGYKCKLCQTVGTTLTIIPKFKDMMHISKVRISNRICIFWSTQLFFHLKRKRQSKLNRSFPF